jgi:transcriptional regulator with XRE-family HTH domain
LADSGSQIADRIKGLRKKAGITQAELAAAINVDAQTVARWERGERRPGAEPFEAAIAHLNRVIGGLNQNVPRATVGEPRSDLYVARQTTEGAGPLLPIWVGQRITAFEREATRAGATDAQLDYIRSVLESHATAKLVLFKDDGSPRERAGQEQQLGLMIDSMRFWLERNPTPDGAPMAPVFATEDPTAAKPHPKRAKK